MAEDTRGWQIFHAANWKFGILNAETPADRRERILRQYASTRCPFERRRLRRQWMEAGGNELIRARMAKAKHRYHRMITMKADPRPDGQGRQAMTPWPLLFTWCRAMVFRWWR